MIPSKRYLILALLSGLLLSIGWFEWGSGLILLMALVPLLLLEQQVFENRNSQSARIVFKYTLFSFLIWNALTTWWISYATLGGGIAAVLLNSLFYTSVFYLFHITRRRVGAGAGYISLIFYWLGFEYFYLNAEISWPWLNLGNAFGNDVLFVQWYEFTGALGGSLWVLVSNILLTVLIGFVAQKKRRAMISMQLVLALWLVVPISWSVFRYFSYREVINPRRIMVIQPNIDPYNEKFNGLTNKQQMDKLLALASQQMDTTIDYLVGPETAIENRLWEESIAQNQAIIYLKSFLQPYPKAKLVVGLTSYRMYFSESEKTPTSRKYPGEHSQWYDSFNSSMQLDSSGNIQLYHKSKLVVGVEMTPYPAFFKFLERFSIDLGGVSGNYGTQKERTPFTAPTDGVKTGTAICYESVYGEYFAQYVKNGANFMCIITNDGWWRDTPGYRQHHSFARLRAIENRRSIARSANTGRSSFINQRGDVLQSTAWWVPIAIVDELNMNNQLTFYTQQGDYIGRTALNFSFLMFVYAVVFGFVRTRKSKG